MSSKTKELIIDGFLSLINERDLEKISVTDIVEKCQISRQTFYYHFDNIEDMLKWSFDKETDLIFNNCRSTKLFEACADYLPFLEKYNSLFQKSVNTIYSTFIANLLVESAYRFSCKFVDKNNGGEINETMEFILKYTSLAFVGLLHQEFQKDVPNYKGLFEKIAKVFSNDSNK